MEGESGVDFMGGFGWGGQRTISSRRGSLLKFVGGVSSEVEDQDGRYTGHGHFVCLFRSKFALAQYIVWKVDQSVRRFCSRNRSYRRGRI